MKLRHLKCSLIRGFHYYVFEVNNRPLNFLHRIIFIIFVYYIALVLDSGQIDLINRNLMYN